MNKERVIKVLFVKPNEEPEVINIRDDLKVMEELVGGSIEEYMPFDDEVALICNEEGELRNLSVNRNIYDENGTIMDVVHGNFFLCKVEVISEVFESLSSYEIEKYKELFKYSKGK